MAANRSELPIWLTDPSWNWYIWHVYVWLFPLICIVGAVMSVCSFVVIVRNPKIYPYVTRQYVIMNSVNDSFTLIVIATFDYFITMGHFVGEGAWSWVRWPLQWHIVTCVLYMFAYFYCVGCSGFFQLGLTIDRLLAVAVPTKAKLLLTPKRSWAMLGVIVTLSLVNPVMYVANWKWKGDVCDMNSVEFFNNVQSPLDFVTRVLLAVALLAGSFGIVGVLAYRRGRVGGAESAGGSGGQLLRLSVMLLGMNATYLVTNVPLYLHLLINPTGAFFSTEYSHAQIVSLYFYMLMFVNNCCNWIFYFGGSAFRRAFVRQFRRLVRVTPTENETQLNSTTAHGVTQRGTESS